MRTSVARHGLTRVEVLVIVVVLAFLAAILLAVVQSMRESSRRTNCKNNLKQIGLAALYYNANSGHLPSAGRIVSDGQTKHVKGWSFLVQILPYVKRGDLQKAIDLDGDPDDGAGDKPIRGVSIPTFICPSNCNKRFADPNADPHEGALTNYKGMGATHIESLNQCLGQGKPLYPAAPGLHPDGVMFPDRGVTLWDVADGAQCTILFVETMDDTASVWTRPTDTILVGLPTSGTGAVTFAKPNNCNYNAPEGFNGKYGDLASDEVKAMRTFMSFDFRPGQADAGTYPAFDGSQPAYGPSSAHPGVIDYVLCDGSVQSISKDLDPAAYMFLITRNCGDPGSRN